VPASLLCATAVLERQCHQRHFAHSTDRAGDAMTHVLEPALGRSRAELPRQSPGPAQSNAGRRLQVLLVGSEFELLALRQAWSDDPIDIDGCEHLAAALVMVGRTSPDLVVVGECLGPIDPFQFLRALRQVDDTTEVVVGLDPGHGDLETDALAAGASAVVRRPFAAGELLNLLHADRRAGVRSGSGPLPIDLGRLKVDVSWPRIWIDDVEVLLPHMEFMLLRYLAERHGGIVSRAELQSAAWGTGPVARSNSLSVHIARLRRRLPTAADSGWICSIRGLGYRLTVPAASHQLSPDPDLVV
jgi:DNA-binding response OmpR family regulator